MSEVRPVADDHGLELDAPASVMVEGNPDDLHRLVLNLVENGVHHTPPGTTVTVSISSRDGDAVVDVSDDGPGLPDGIGDQIFSRFVRGNGPADRAGDSGTGLGLAIVKAVTASHGGASRPAGRTTAARGSPSFCRSPSRLQRSRKFFSAPLQPPHTFRTGRDTARRGYPRQCLAGQSIGQF